MFYAAAALSPATCGTRLEAVAARRAAERSRCSRRGARPRPSPLVTQVHFPIDRAGVIGAAGARRASSTLVPERRQARDARARPERHARLLAAGGRARRRRRSTSEGFYPMGDAGAARRRRRRPARGVVFDGRMAENFKLVDRHLGPRRRRSASRSIAACAPLVAGRRDHRPRSRRGRPLVFPSLAPRGLCRCAPTRADALIAEPAVRRR